MARAADKTAGQVRAEAASMARNCAAQRQRDGYPEGSEVIKDLERNIRSIEIVNRAKSSLTFMPRLFSSDPDAIKAVDHLLDHPEELRDHLLLAGGLCQGRAMYAAAAAVLIAADRLGLFEGQD